MEAGREIEPKTVAVLRYLQHFRSVQIRDEGPDLAVVSKAFANDLFLALSCRQACSVLVTENEREFARIRRFLPLEFVPC